MAPGPLHPVTVLEQCDVSPSPAAGQPPALPLTFFDLVFWGFPPVQRLFFYDNPDLVSGFTAGELPRLKKSLAAALHHFYPLAGKLTCEMTDGVAPPEVLFAHGDSVPLTVAVSADDFGDLAGDHPRDTARLRPLLPMLRKHGGQSQDVLAVQVTVFPRAGVCIGTTLHHAVADGSSYAHFLRTWASIHRRLGGLDVDECTKATAMDDDAPPLFDRAVVRDDAGLREAFLRDHRALAKSGDTCLDDWDLSRRSTGDVVLATFRFTDTQLRALGKHVESETSARCSPYALACAAAWAGIVHARRQRYGGDMDGEVVAGDMDGEVVASSEERFGFVTGCKPRARPPIPASYFGNCLGLCSVESTRLVNGGGGLTAASTAAAAIWRVIEELGEEGRALRDARGWVRSVREHAAARAVTVAGSPKLRLYAAADLGGAWGRPRKVEIVSVERTGALALAESGRDGEGGIEVGLALPRAEMEAFRKFYVDLFDSLSAVS
ncbi:hypothetical protein HU200_041520 [Digitaria exilis]|uniref:Uncharacterized protein n=1 Tax=Digitaria exilis TaxID=1010633 RepID=A0A835EHU2_9POAL|nr:hypothetical protein HU200_041520 [Digitaria exilis]CAB3448195.1 unnamed protein product [Digitaria exilis]